MRAPHHLRSGEVSFNMTPMIDVVFLLIIFFLVSSHLAKQEIHMELPLPVAESGNLPAESLSPRITVNITQEGKYLLAGRRVPKDEFQARLAERLARDGKDLEVRIRSDRNVAYRHVEPILRNCASLGVWNVTFAVYRKENAR